MKIQFWGVRGSIASPGQETAEFGGNTSCVEVDCGEERIVLDAGTGLRNLGNRMLAQRERLDLTLLLSHYHWDHIQGLPFFVPVYMKDTELCIVGQKAGVMGAREALFHQMQAPVFPVRLDEVGARIETKELRAGESMQRGPARITAMKLNHPGGVFAYRISSGGRSVVYATDTEHYACVDPALAQLAAGADLLIYDAQYTPDEYPRKVGWGHSTYVAGCEVARAAGVKQLALFHHDPLRTDAGVREIEARAKELFPATFAAKEGMIVDLVNEPLVDRSAA
jgi:phosphoribosyl 1,2-cyclic phosphodiesterase